LIKTQSGRKTILLILCFDKLSTSNQENQGSDKYKLLMIERQKIECLTQLNFVLHSKVGNYQRIFNSVYCLKQGVVTPSKYFATSL